MSPRHSRAHNYRASILNESISPVGRYLPTYRVVLFGRIILYYIMFYIRYPVVIANSSTRDITFSFKIIAQSRERIKRTRVITALLKELIKYPAVYVYSMYRELTARRVLSLSRVQLIFNEKKKKKKPERDRLITDGGDVHAISKRAA